MDSKKGKNKPIKKQNEAKNNNKIVHGKKESKEKKKEIMEKCYECYCENGLRDTGIKELGKYCGMTSASQTISHISTTGSTMQTPVVRASAL